MTAEQSLHMQKSVNRGLAWVGVASSLVGVLDIIATLLILNFWVSADDYGVATLCMWIFPILDQATDLSTAVIQNETHDENHASTVFWVNLGIAVVLFGVLLIAAPLIGDLYEHAVIGAMLIAYGTKLVWQNVYIMPIALLKRELRFKELSVIRIVANLAEFGAKVGFAAAGFSIWCFVLGPLARALVTGIGAQLRHPWRPRLKMNIAEAKEHVVFGLRTSGSGLLFHLYTNLDYPVVGYYFGDYWLGIYRLAYEVVLEPVRIISAVVVDIAFPAFAKLRHKRDRLIQQLISFTRLNLITVMAYSAVVLIAGDDLLAVVFPDYVEAATAVRILCAVAVVRAISFVLPPLLDGIGQPTRTFTYSVVAAILLPVMFILGAVLLRDQIGMLAVPVAWAVGYPIAFGVLLWLTMHSIGWSVGAYFRSIAGVAACMVGGAVVGAGVHYALGGFVPVVRLVVTSGSIVLTIGMLLAYTQGISIRSAMRGMKAEVASTETPPMGTPVQ